MCGIAGILTKDKDTINQSLLLPMAETLSHRGRDGERFGLFNTANGKHQIFNRTLIPDFKGNLGFAHRRLSVIDLSESASQPMSDEDKKLWIVYNGEIFNYLEIKEELREKRYSFSTHSDTEVVLKAYQEWGKDCLNRFNGMWAFVIYDKDKKILFGSRDRFGIKPFYYHLSSHFFSFASEIKSLLKLPWISREPFHPVIKEYLFYSRVNTSENTFFKNIKELKPGCFFYIDLNKNFNLKVRRWWDLPQNLPHPPCTEEEALEKFRKLLISSIKLRLRSDVPVGTCLSGGVDSSAIVSLAQPFLDKENQKTFSIIHPGFKYDESAYIEELTSQKKISSFKESINGRELEQDLEELIHIQDEPFTSTSMYAQWKVFKLAKRNGVTVTLDGQGADEILAGYPYFKFVYWAELLYKLNLIKYGKEMFFDSSSLSGFMLNLLASFSGFFPHRKMISLAGIKDPQYRVNILSKQFFKNIPLSSSPVEKRFSSPLNQRLYEVFTQDGLPALLRYADRNSMAHTLESRMPFLDHRLVSFLFSLPPELKVNRGWSKYILRKSIPQDLPPKILNRKDKIGFETPEADWFRNELCSWIEGIINSSSLKKRGFYNIKILKRTFHNHKKGVINASRPLWRVINLELWQRNYMD